MRSTSQRCVVLQLETQNVCFSLSQPNRNTYSIRSPRSQTYYPNLTGNSYKWMNNKTFILQHVRCYKQNYLFIFCSFIFLLQCVYILNIIHTQLHFCSSKEKKIPRSSFATLSVFNCTNIQKETEVKEQHMENVLYTYSKRQISFQSSSSKLSVCVQKFSQTFKQYTKKYIRKDLGLRVVGQQRISVVTYLCMENILMGARLWIMCFRSSVYIVKTGKLEIYTKYSNVYVLCAQ